MKRSEYYIRPQKVPSSRARLVSFPYAGAGAVVYYQWAAGLLPDIELICIQYPGRGRLNKMAPCTRIEEVVAECCATVSALSDKPFYFFGHSMGALVAFETVRTLRSSGKPLPQALIISACDAPQAIQHLEGNLHDLSDEHFLAGVQRYGVIPAEIMQSQDMMAYLLPLLRADMTALETWRYKPAPPLPIPILVLTGHEDKTVNIEELKRWRDCTTASFQCHIMPGNHFYYRDQLPRVLDKIRSMIGETEAGC